ncbi:hypothetical protein [Nocardia amikacinitolerans]|uniref:hypothetical protein n=1 Tax=Nocardia amikacinitolerans TaxID=756689 RepID=UPI0020A55969|nr:hypothetical protein [Nocardia amikacinitolerans]MCP2287914.1 hypothetical protein [Nocardia amikacinitolerans]
MRRTLSTLVVLAMLFATGSVVAAAEPAAPAPARSDVALLTLTTMPRGWQERIDLRPLLQVHADGRAVHQPDAIAPERNPNTPPRQVGGTVRREVIDAALAEITALSTVDLGMPASGDGSQIIDMMPEPPGQNLHLIVYGPDSTDGLTAEQQNARKRFADVYRSLLDAFVADR